MDEPHIRPATLDDWPSIWPIFRAVIAGGDTYVFAPETDETSARSSWLAEGVRTFVIELAGRIAGMSRIVANQRDLGSHVANASFVIDPALSGRGLGEALGRHALVEARRLGFLAMQFNFVVATNTGALRLWRKLGFEVVGTLPRAFRHRRLGFVDALVMHRFLDDVDAPG